MDQLTEPARERAFPAERCAEDRTWSVETKADENIDVLEERSWRPTDRRTA